MRARLLATSAAALLALAACGDGAATASKVDTTPTDDLANAVEIAQLTMPTTLSDAKVGSLIDELCSAAASGDAAAFTASLQGLPLDEQTQKLTALDALSIGAGDYCDDPVSAVVPAVESAIAPAAATTTTAPAATGAAGASGTASTGSGSRSGTSGSSASGTSGSSGSSSGGSSGGSSNQSTGSAQVGGGNASGSGNQSGTDFTQSVTNGSTAGTVAP